MATPPSIVSGWHVRFDKGSFWYGEWAVTTSPRPVRVRCDMRARRCAWSNARIECCLTSRSRVMPACPRSA